MMLIDPFRVSVGPMTLAFIAATGSGAVNLPTITFSSVNIGTAHARRKVIISVHWSDPGTTPNLTSATIGGVAASIDLIGTGLTLTGIYSRSAIISADVPSGTTASVVLNFNASTNFAYIGVYRATNAIYPAPIDTESVAVLTPGATVNIDVKKDGALVAAANMDLPVTWSGITEHYEDAIVSRFTGAGDETTADATGYAVTCNGSGSTAGAPRRTLIAVSYR